MSMLGDTRDQVSGGSRSSRSAMPARRTSSARRRFRGLLAGWRTLAQSRACARWCSPVAANAASSAGRISERWRGWTGRAAKPSSAACATFARRSAVSRAGCRAHPGMVPGRRARLATACALVAAPTAHFAMPEVKLGIPSVIHAALMPRLIGTARARWLDSHPRHDRRGNRAAIGAGRRRCRGRGAGWGGNGGGCADPGMRASGDCDEKALLRDWEDLPLAEAIEQACRHSGVLSHRRAAALHARLPRRQGRSDRRQKRRTRLVSAGVSRPTHRGRALECGARPKTAS